MAGASTALTSRLVVHAGLERACERLHFALEQVRLSDHPALG